MSDDPSSAWRQLSVLRCREPEQVEQCLLVHGAVSITLEDAADEALLEPDPGQHPLWRQTRISALFGADQDLQATRADLLSMGLDAAAIVIGELPDEDWVRAWMRHYRPVRLGRIQICPSHLQAEPDTDAVVIRLDPGLAFGTGAHATTRLCLQWLDSADVSGKTVIDYGCGSGILAIAAAKLGAGLVYAIDHDAQALLATRDNAERNAVSAQIIASLPQQLPSASPLADILIANIIARPLLELKATFLQLLKPHAQLFMSGISSAQADVVAAAYLPEASLIARSSCEDWVALEFRRNG